MVPAEGHHDVRGRVGPDPGQREQSLLELLVRQLLRGRGRERLQVELAPGDRARELQQVGAAIPGAGDVLVEGLAGLGHGRGRREGPAPGTVRVGAGRPLSQVLDDRVDHPRGGRPGAVGRADRLDHVLEHRRALDHAPGPRGHPREVGIGGRGLVERRQVGIEPQDVTDRRGELGRRAFGRRRAEDRDLRVTPAPRLDPDRPRASATGAQGEFDRAVVGRRPHRRQVHEPVGVQRPDEIDGFAAGTAQTQVDGRHPSARWRSRQARTLARLPQVDIEHHRPERFFERS